MHRKVFNKMKLHAMAAEVLYLLGGTSIDCGVRVNTFLNENMPEAVISERLLSSILVHGVAHVQATVDAIDSNLAVSYSDFIEMLAESLDDKHDLTEYALRLAEVKHHFYSLDLFKTVYARFYGTAEDRCLTRDFRPGKLVVRREHPAPSRLRHPSSTTKHVETVAFIEGIVIDKECTSELYWPYMVREYAETFRNTLVLLSYTAFDALSDSLEITGSVGSETFEHRMGLEPFENLPYYRVVPFHELAESEKRDV